MFGFCTNDTEKQKLIVLFSKKVTAFALICLQVIESNDCGSYGESRGSRYFVKNFLLDIKK